MPNLVVKIQKCQYRFSKTDIFKVADRRYEPDTFVQLVKMFAFTF